MSNVVGSGHTSSGLTAGSGVTISVLGGGVTVGTMVASGGAEAVFAGGVASATIVAFGGSQLLSSGAEALGTVVSGGLEVVSAGAAAIGSFVTGSGVSANGYEVLTGTAVASLTDIGSGGGAFVLSGAAIAGARATAGGFIAVSNGGVAYATSLAGGGGEYLYSGAAASGATVNSGGFEVASFGGVTSAATVNDSGGLYLFSGGAAVAPTINGGGFEIISKGGVAESAFINSAGADYVYAGGVSIDATVNAGGFESVGSGGLASGVILSSGGEMALGSAASAVGAFVASGGYEVISLGANATLTTLLPGGFIDIAALFFASGGSASFDSASDVLSVTVGSASYSQTLAGSYAGEVFTLASDGASVPGTLIGLQAAPCFAAGTRIATERGAVAVQDLRIGDAVALADGGFAPVRWLGHRSVDCARHPRPWDVHPVRIAAHAFAPGQPARDLWLSPDHAVWTGGALIPARYLVNGATLVQQAVPAIGYWHVELPEHAVLLAEGLPCESYLDTGNRSAFANGGKAVMAHPDFARGVWQARACAPLATGGPAVIAARRNLLDRAGALGHAMSQDSGLRVLTDDGELPMIARGALRGVRLPPGVQQVRLVSRQWVPAQMRPAESDARTLGVAISGLWLDGRGVALDSPGFAGGWHAPEAGLRWTDGAGVLAVAGVRELAFEVALTGDYWLGAAVTPPVRPAAALPARTAPAWSVARG